MAPKTTKCPGCGRERVAITKKGYLRPHVKTDGRPCMILNVPTAVLEETLRERSGKKRARRP